jgi:CheY-like chemotaxis protein
LNLESVGITRNVSYCSDGLIASNTAIDFLKEAKANFCEYKLRPISAMLLDIQMPMKSGLQVVEEVRTFCKENSDKLICPIFIFLSSYIT